MVSEKRGAIQSELEGRLGERSNRTDCKSATLTSPAPVETIVKVLKGGRVTLSIRNRTSEYVEVLPRGIGKSFQNLVDVRVYRIAPQQAVEVLYSYADNSPKLLAPDIVYSFSTFSPTTKFINSALEWPISSGLGVISQSPTMSVRHPTHTLEGMNENAVDIRAPFGANVVAAISGRVMSVVDSNPDFYCGSLDFDNRIVVVASDGTEVIYGHLMRGSSKVTQGDWVRAGQPIARVGRSGGMKVSHLHIQRGYLSTAGYQTVPIHFLNMP